MDEDIKLVERYISGDEKSIEELVMRYQKQIYGFIYRMTNDIEEAKDLTQKTFVSAINGIRGFRKEASFKTWLYQIAINTSLNHIRQSRHEEIEIEESIVGNQADALSTIIEKEKKDHIKRGLHELPERQRLAIVLRVYDGLSCGEAAKVMGCSEGAVKAHYHNGVKRLREILKERGYEIRS
ncbi:MAG: sigma-70 family RNA polymerase sigma factor [Thermodesulfovibrionales bacterium]|nr:sigma-70 family RNA polymerase sigma factor [Thermodesulfovibrionales bacterium]